MVLLRNHTTGEARSRFLAPVRILPLTARSAEYLNIHQIFNRVVTQFGSFRNSSESMNGITTRRRIVYHFGTSGALRSFTWRPNCKGSNEDRSNTVALVMTECDGQAFL